jgi:ethanolamine ammonia-lyase small subunit
MTGEDDNPPARITAESDLWNRLRRLTPARIGLARHGASPATAPMLDFRLAHARARDAVHARLDAAKLVDDLGGLGLPVLTVASAAASKQDYLMRPDLGRRLAPNSESTLGPDARDCDVVFVVSDGLSAQAVQNHAAPLLALAVAELKSQGWHPAPIVIAVHGRVAIGDRVAALLRARCVVVLIGERPGLSAPDSMSIYVTWQPGPQTSDAERNCISNIRPGGIAYADAAFKLLHLMHAMRLRGLSGVGLKDETDRLSITAAPLRSP